MIERIVHNIPGTMPFKDCQIIHNWVKEAKIKKDSIVVEIGTGLGRTTGVLRHTLDKSIKIYTVDDYSLFDRYWKRFPERSHIPQNNLKNLNLDFNIDYIKEGSLDFGKRESIGKMDFVFIDGNHLYEEVIKDLHLWYYKLKKGCWIMGDDFGPIINNEGKYIHINQETY